MLLGNKSNYTFHNHPVLACMHYIKLHIYIYIYMACLIYTPEAQGLQARGLRVYIYQANHECTWYNYYVTLSFYANGFTIFIVVLIAFDCGFIL